MTDFIIIAIILLLCIPGIRGIVKAAKGNETCECPGDCSRCGIRCRSNEKYWGKVPPSQYKKHEPFIKPESGETGGKGGAL